MPTPDPVPPWARPNPNSWPAAVTSQADMRQFVEMMTGCKPENQIDLSHLLPGLAAVYEDVSDCFLFFVPASSKPYVDLRAHIDPLHLYWMSNTTSGIPKKAIIVGTDFYESVQISRGACACQYNFGGSSELVTKVIPAEVVPSNRCAAGIAFQQKLDGFIDANIQSMARVQNSDTPLKAWWRKGHWHCLLNKYASTRNHGIAFHDDDGPETYDTTKDPVVSYSFDSPAPLFIRHRNTYKSGKKVPVLLVHQRDGDALIMGGAFQKKFEHMVPSLHQWLRAQPGQDLQVPREDKPHILTALSVNGSNGFDEDRLAMAHRRATDPTFQAIRCNVNVRWHRKHFGKGCPYKERESVELPHWQAETEGLVQRRRQAWEDMARARTEPEPIRPAPTMHLVGQQISTPDGAPWHAPGPRKTPVPAAPQEAAQPEPSAPHPQPCPASVVRRGDAAEAHSHEDAAHVMRTADVLMQAEAASERVAFERVENELTHLAGTHINTLIDVLTTMYTVEVLREQHCLMPFCPSDDQTKNLVIRDTYRHLGFVTKTQQKLADMAEWIEDHRIKRVQEYCDFYIGFLRHRIEYFERCFPDCPQWPVDARLVGRADSRPSAGKYSERWWIPLRRFSQWTEQDNFVQLHWDSKNWRVALAPPGDTDVEWDTEKEPETKRARTVAGRRYILFGIDFGDVYKQRVSVRQQVLENRLRSRQQDPTIHRQMAEAFQYWLKHAALHELHLSEDETMKVWLYLQDADQHDRYIASKR